MQDILVKTLMSDDIESVTADTELGGVIDLMAAQRRSCIIITDQSSPVGIITERDLVRLLQQRPETTQLCARKAAEIMSSPIITLNQDQSLFDALVIARAHHIRHFPVVDNQEALVGLITTSDLANAHFHVVELQSELIRQSVELKTQELARANQELLALSLEDHLTATGNRRAMEVDLRHTHASALRYRQLYSLILMDLDYFKRFNDHYGHAAGDEALKETATFIKQSVRACDRLYRYGGEEMLLLLPSTDLNQATLLANKLVHGLVELNIPHEKSPERAITMSAGVACVSQQGKICDHWQEVIKLADAALYQAKEQGRNQARGSA